MTLTTRRLTWLMIRLRTKLTVASMGTMGRVLYVFAAAVAGLGAFTVVAGIAALRTEPEGPDVIAVVGFGLGVAWMLGAAATGSSQYAVDPRQFLLLPIPEHRLMASYLFASVLTLPAGATLIVSLAPVFYAQGPITFGLLVIGGLVQWAQVVLMGRGFITGLDSLLGGRRSRDLAVFVTTLAGLFIGIAFQFLAIAASFVDRFGPIRQITRWLPWGLGGEALALLAEGDLVRGCLWLGAAAGLTALMFYAWSTLTLRNLQVRSDNARSAGSDVLAVGPLRFLPARPVIATWSRSLRQLRRDVRELVEVASILPLAFFSALPALGAIQAANETVVILAGMAGTGAGIVTLNLFGADGPNYGVDLLTARDQTVVVWGKVLARLTLIMVLVMVTITALAAWTRGWHYWPLGMGIAIATACGGIAAGTRVSVTAPIAMPDTASFTGFNNGSNDTSAALLRLAFLAVIGIVGFGLTGVIYLLVKVWLPGAYIAALLVAGAGVAIMGLAVRWAGHYLNVNGPEVLAKLRERQNS